MRAFNDKAIRATLPATGRGELTDPQTVGLFLRGNRYRATWTLRRTIGGNPVRVVLGEFPSLGTSKAREAAQAVIAQAAQPGGNRAVGRDGGLAATGNRAISRCTLEGLLEAWEAAHGHLRRTTGRRRALERCFASLLPKDAGHLDTHDYLRVADRLSHGARTKALRDLRAVLRWAGERGLAPEGTLQNVRLPRGASREHVPTLAEVRAAYAFAAADDHAAAPLYQWLVLTAWRAGECRHLHTDWLSLRKGTVTVPAASSKDKREHTHPLSVAMLELLGRGHSAGIVFRRDDGEQMHSHSTLSFYHEQVMKACQKADADFRRFTLHDCRRAFATHLADAGADLLAIELALGHSPSRMLGSVGAIYNRSQRWEQRLALYEMWAEMMV